MSCYSSPFYFCVDPAALIPLEGVVFLPSFFLFVYEPSPGLPLFLDPAFSPPSSRLSAQRRIMFMPGPLPFFFPAAHLGAASDEITLVLLILWGGRSASRANHFRPFLRPFPFLSPAFFFGSFPAGIFRFCDGLSVCILCHLRGQ